MSEANLPEAGQDEALFDLSECVVPPAPPRSLDAMLTDARRVLDAAEDEHQPIKTFVLFSGGNDSLVLLDAARRYGWAPDGVVHVNTGTGVPETTDFVRQVCDDWNLNLHELTPPKSYEEVFIDDPIIDGLPGPGMHHIAYTRLKERAVMAFIQAEKTHRMDRIALLTGIRRDESRRRMGYGETVIDRRGATVWVNPIYTWTTDEMRDYKALYNLPRNPVSEHLHMSGECLCGAYAKPGELDEIEFFYPEVAARIRAWEAAAEAKGLTYCKWGERRPDVDVEADDGGRMCTKCVAWQLETLFDLEPSASAQEDAA